MGIRLVVVDDNPHLAWDGRVHPANATFQRFLAAARSTCRTSPVAIDHHRACRSATRERAPADPAARPADPGRRDGAVRRDRRLPAPRSGDARREPATLRRAIGAADLVWLKVPASNAALAAAIARRGRHAAFRLGRRQRGRRRRRRRFDGIARVGAGRVGLGYDASGGWPARRPIALVGRRGARRRRRDRRQPGRAGRDARPGGAAVAAGDGRAAPARLGRPAGRRQGPRVACSAAVAARPGASSSTSSATGPTASAGRARRRRLGVADRVDVGAATSPIARRTSTRSRRADVFVFPSPAEGFPKVVLDAFAVGPAGRSRRRPVRSTSSSRRVSIEPDRAVPTPAPSDRGLAADSASATASAVASGAGERAPSRPRHTRPAEAARLVERWRAWWPDLPWDALSA